MDFHIKVRVPQVGFRVLDLGAQVDGKPSHLGCGKGIDITGYGAEDRSWCDLARAVLSFCTVIFCPYKDSPYK